MTLRAELVEPRPQARFGRRVALEGATQIQPRLSEVSGRSGLVLFRPTFGVVIVRGPRAHAAGEGIEFSRGDHGESVHTSIRRRFSCRRERS